MLLKTVWMSNNGGRSLHGEVLDVSPLMLRTHRERVEVLPQRPRRLVFKWPLSMKSRCKRAHLFSWLPASGFLVESRALLTNQAHIEHALNVQPG